MQRSCAVCPPWLSTPYYKKSDAVHSKIDAILTEYIQMLRESVATKTISSGVQFGSVLDWPMPWFAIYRGLLCAWAVMPHRIADFKEILVEETKHNSNSPIIALLENGTRTAPETVLFLLSREVLKELF
eukprot:PhM_4_TR14764/c0_g1_i1/m.15762